MSIENDATGSPYTNDNHLEEQINQHEAQVEYEVHNGNFQFDHTEQPQPQQNGVHSSLEANAQHSNPASPDQEGPASPYDDPNYQGDPSYQDRQYQYNNPASPAAPASPDMGPASPDMNPASPDPDEESSPESPPMDEGQVSDDGEDMDYQNFVPNDEPRSPVEYTSDLDQPGSEDEEESEEQRLGKLRHMRFKGPRPPSKLSAPPRRTVRSFLDEKGAEDIDVTAFAARPAKSERDESREEPREKRKKKKKHEREDREKEKIPPITFESRPHPYNPSSVAMKVQSLISRVDMANSFEAEGDFDDEDIRNILMEAILLENELEETYDKREKLLTEMDTMATTEKENIKKLHAELPPHLQSVVSVDGDTIGITDAPNGAPLLPPMFPTMPSLLSEGAPIFQMTAEGLPTYDLSGLPMNGSHTPPPENENVSPRNWKTPDQLRLPPMTPPTEPMWLSHFPDGETRSLDTSKLPSFIDGMPMSITFALPPLNAYTDTDGENPTESYQLPPNPGAPGVLDISKTLIRTIASLCGNTSNQGGNAPVASASPAQGAPSTLSNSMLSGGVASPLKVEARPNPPSLMSIPTMDPFGGQRLAPPTCFRAGRTAPRSAGRSGHAESPR